MNRLKLKKENVTETEKKRKFYLFIKCRKGNKENRKRNGVSDNKIGERIENAGKDF